jgi:Ser/Thr protein kinase RdoA (MazF antagonist)
MPLNVGDLPRFSPEAATRLAFERYGVVAVAQELPSERDQNFYLRDQSGTGFVLKIAGAGERREILEAQNAATDHIARHGRSVHCPRVLPTVSGHAITSVRSASGTDHFVRLVTWIPGVILARVRPHTPELLRSLGGFLGRLDEAFLGFSHPAARRDFHWDLRRTAATIAGFLEHIGPAADRALVERFLERFASDVQPRFPELRVSVIHNDANDHNVVVSDDGTSSHTVVGIIDFGDMVESCTVFDLAVGAAYAALDKPDPVAAGGHIIAGYHASFPLEDAEVELLYDLIVARLCLSISLSAYQRKQNPENDYLSVSEPSAWETLRFLSAVDPEAATTTFRNACKSQA